LLAVLLAVAMTAGCGSSGTTGNETSPGQITGNVTHEDVQATVGEEFNIALDSNPTTGYLWDITKQPSATVVQSEGSEFVQSTGSSGLAGAGGEQVWKFKALAVGTTDMILENLKSGTSQPAATHGVSVTVVAPSSGLTTTAQEPKTYTKASTPINESVGNEFRISLTEQSASTGFKWLLSSSYNHKVCVFKGVLFGKAPSTPGGTQVEIYRFQALGAGTTKLAFRYVQPWDKTTAPAKTSTFTVNVK
jgi:predicted secreted protein